MKFLHLAFVFVLVISACNKMESSEPVTPAQAITSAAENLNRAVLNNDYDTFAKYTHPKIVEALGGEAKFKELTEQGAKRMQSDSAKFISISNGTPGKIITVNGELQTTIPQTVEVKIPTGKVKSKTTLIAVSKDDGKNWLFVNTANTDLKRLQKILPTLSNDLVIPQQQQPEFIQE
ncbi:MAG: hypothetical protein V4642_08555 [Bacteroidota bacterium]